MNELTPPLKTIKRKSISGIIRKFSTHRLKIVVCQFNHEFNPKSTLVQPKINPRSTQNQPKFNPEFSACNGSVWASNTVKIDVKCHLHMSFDDLGEPYAKVPWNLKLCSIHVEWTQPRSSAFNCVHLRPIAFNSVYAGSGGFMRVHAGSCGSMRGNVNL